MSFFISVFFYIFGPHCMLTTVLCRSAEINREQTKQKRITYNIFLGISTSVMLNNLSNIFSIKSFGLSREREPVLSWREGSEGWALIWLSWPCGLPCLWEKRKIPPEVDNFCQIHNNIELVLSYNFSEVLGLSGW